MRILINQYELVATFFPYYVCNMCSLVAQLVKNPPAMQETPVQFLGWEGLLEKG